MKRKMLPICVMVSLLLGVVSSLYSSEPFFDLSLIRVSGMVNVNDDFHPSIGLNPMIAVKIPGDIKIYGAFNLDMSPGLYGYVDLGIGKEWMLNESFSIEPFVLLSWGGYYEGSDGSIYGGKLACRLNWCLNPTFKLFIESGINPQWLVGRVYSPEEGQYTRFDLKIPLVTGCTFCF